MPKYYGCLRRIDSQAAYALTFEAKNVPDAIDKLMFQCYVESPDQVEQYELFRVLDEPNVGYIPVASKGQSKSILLDAEHIEEKVFTEEVYVSYRDVA